MCKAIAHTAQREVKAIMVFCGKGNRKEVCLWVLSMGGSEKVISKKLAPSTRKPSVSLKILK